MALSEGLRSFVDFFTKSFDARNEEDAFEFETGMDEYAEAFEGNVAKDLDAMYGTRVAKPERSFERESKVVSHPKHI